MEASTQPPTESPNAPSESEKAAARAGETPARRTVSSAQFLERWALLFAWIAVVILFSLIKPDTYPTSGNFQTIFGSQAVLLMLTLGLILPLTTGDFDLSIASNMSLTSMLI